MITALKTDNFLDAEAILLSGLYIDAPYGETDEKGLSSTAGSTLLHAAVDLNVCSVLR